MGTCQDRVHDEPAADRSDLTEMLRLHDHAAHALHKGRHLIPKAFYGLEGWLSGQRRLLPTPTT